MYRCGNKAQLGDCITIQVDIDVKEMKIKSPTIGMVLDINYAWSSEAKPLLTIKMPDDSIQELPASWCTLCQRK